VQPVLLARLAVDRRFAGRGLGHALISEALRIPGTSVGHLRENLTAATLELPPETISQLDLISRASKTARAD
jgi:ribosomal protein S18 acetylase RimI-like enzyme